MMEHNIDVGKLAVSYKRLVLWFGVQLVIAIIGAVGIAFAVDPVLRGLLEIARILGILVTIVALLLYSYRTAVALGSQVSILWALAMLIPCINAVTLLVLSFKATKACRAAGITVGFFGPKIAQSADGTEHDEDVGI